MRKKTIIIAALSALVLAGAAVGAVYTLDGGRTATPDAPIEQQLTSAQGAGQNEPPADVQGDGQDLQSKVDILARAMAENGNFTEDSIRSVKERNWDINALYDFRDMNEEQIKDYAARLSQVNRCQRDFGLGYLRIRAEILGKMSADGPRLTVEALEELINQSHSRKELYSSIRAQYGEADFIYSGDIGGTMAEYWLNDEGTEWLLFQVGSIENGVVRQVGLCRYDSDEHVTGELLYSSDDLKALYSEEK